MLGDDMIRTWSKTQTNIALSSAESEFYATLKAAQESLGMAAMIGEMNQTLKIRVLVDASAALGVAQRQGLGKLRHLQTGALWIQEQEIKRRMKLSKVAGSLNTSDILTKNIQRELLENMSRASEVSSWGGELRMQSNCIWLSAGFDKPKRSSARGRIASPRTLNLRMKLMSIHRVTLCGWRFRSWRMSPSSF